MSLYVYKLCNAWENGFELTPILVWWFKRIIYLDRFVCLHFKGMFIIKLVLYLPLGCSFKFSHIFIFVFTMNGIACVRLVALFLCSTLTLSVSLPLSLSAITQLDTQIKWGQYLCFKYHRLKFIEYCFIIWKIVIFTLRKYFYQQTDESSACAYSQRARSCTHPSNRLLWRANKIKNIRYKTKKKETAISENFTFAMCVRTID